MVRDGLPVLWLTGLSAAGKTTLATALVRRLRGRGLTAVLVDGDALRRRSPSPLGFGRPDRRIQARRAAAIAQRHVLCGRIPVVALVSPFRADRALAARLLAPAQLVEVFIDTPLAVCMQRDARGLYRAAVSGTVRDLCGVDAPYQAPRRGLRCDGRLPVATQVPHLLGRLLRR